MTDNSVSLTWQPPSDGSVTHYVVHYSMVEEFADKSTNNNFEMDQQLNATKTEAIVANLTSKKLYKFFVLASNEYGTSLPSSIVTVNVTSQGNQSDQ